MLFWNQTSSKHIIKWWELLLLKVLLILQISVSTEMFAFIEANVLATGSRPCL